MTIPALSEYSNGSAQLRPSTTLESITIVIAVSNLSRSEVNNKKAQPPTLQSAFNHRHTVIILMPNYVDQQSSAAAAQSCVQHNTHCLELSMIQELGESKYESQHHYVAKNQSESRREGEREREMRFHGHYKCMTLYNKIIVQYDMHVYQYKVRGRSSEQ